MDAQTISLANIEAQISAARERLATLDGDAKALALPAVNGDQEAVNAIAKVNASIRQVTADISVLNNARLAAERQKADAAAEATAAHQARHLQIARGHAAELSRLAARADELVDAFDAVLGEMAATERDIWSALHQAGVRPNTAIVGRTGLSRFADGRMQEVINRLNKVVRHQKPVAEVAAVAWADLLSPEGAADE